MPLPGASETRDEECNVGAGAFAVSICVCPGVLTMSVNAPITSVDCRTEARSHTHRTFPDGFVTFIRFTVRAREGTNGGIGIVYPQPTPMLRSRSGAWPVRTSDASGFSAGAGLHRGSFRRTDRVVAGKGRSKCRRS